MRTQPIPTLAAAGLLAALALPGAAWADPAPPPDMQIGGTRDCRLDGAGEHTYRIVLARNQDYAIAGAHEDGPDVIYTLRDAGGTPLATFGHDAGEMFEGRSFRAPYAGAYFIDVAASGPADLWPRWCAVSVEPDQLANRTTHGALPVGLTRPTKSFDYDGDRDWFATSLTKGRRYLARLIGPGFLDIRDAQGRVIASAYAFTATNETDLPFTAPRSGAYFVEAIDQSGDQAGYSIGLAPR